MIPAVSLKPLPMLMLLFGLLPAADAASQATDPVLDRIAFGSCLQQGQPQPIWDAILASGPGLFVFLGDNIYGDTEEMDVLARKWTQFRSETGFQRLWAQARVTGVWDDHDYGQNDAGKEYPKKAESKRLLLDALGDAPDSARRSRDGIYDVRTFGPPGRRVQVILLDTRWFRDTLSKAADRQANRGPYRPSDDPNATVLGAAQWQWLQEQFSQPADLRIVASSIQFVPVEHGWEKWQNFPAERQRMIDLIAHSGATGVIFITGDRHHAEISRLTGDGAPYPLFDLTSSSLNKPGKGANNDEPNRWRLGEVYHRENFGLIEIEWSDDPQLTFSIRDVAGKPVLQRTVRLSELRPAVR